MSQQVLVDNGDLSEAIQSAEAWAGYLRNTRVRELRKEIRALPAVGGGLTRGSLDEDIVRYTTAADRIDQAVHHLREQSHTLLKPTLLDFVDDAFDLDAIDVLNESVPDDYANREFAGAIATLIVAVLDKKDPGALNAMLNELFGYQGGHHQPHDPPVAA
jgi:hypothetical protein